MATANMAAVGNTDLKIKAGCVWNTAITINSPVQSAVMQIKKGTEEPALNTLAIGSGLTLAAPNKIIITGPCLVRRDYYVFDMEVVLTGGITFYIVGKIFFYDA